jgi:hypothetical protein
VILGKRVCFLAVALIGLFALLSSRTFDPTQRFGTFGPGLLPLLLGTVLGVLGLIGVVRPGPTPEQKERYDVRPFVTMIAVMAGYVVLFRVLGFFLDTMLCATILVILLARDRLWVTLFGMVGFVSLTYGVLHIALQVQFPSPSWFAMR